MTDESEAESIVKSVSAQSQELSRLIDQFCTAAEQFANDVALVAIPGTLEADGVVRSTHQLKNDYSFFGGLGGAIALKTKRDEKSYFVLSCLSNNDAAMERLRDLSHDAGSLMAKVLLIDGRPFASAGSPSSGWISLLVRRLWQMPYIAQHHDGTFLMNRPFAASVFLLRTLDHEARSEHVGNEPQLIVKKRRGRPKGKPATDQKFDKKVFEAWDGRKGSYRTFEELGRAFDISAHAAKRAKERHRDRLRE